MWQRTTLTDRSDLRHHWICIGTGPGPKNVMVEFLDGTRTVTTYGIWKELLKPHLMKETSVAKGSYLATVGIVQQFPDKEVVTERELNDQDIREFTIKTITKQTLVRITIGPEFANAKIGKGDQVGVDGSFTTSESKGKTYHNIWARELAITKAETKLDVDRPERANEVEKDEEEAPF